MNTVHSMTLQLSCPWSVIRMDPKPFWLLAQDPRGKPQVRRRLCLALLVLNYIQKLIEECICLHDYIYIYIIYIHSYNQKYQHTFDAGRCHWRRSTRHLAEMARSTTEQPVTELTSRFVELRWAIAMCCKEFLRIKKGGQVQKHSKTFPVAFDKLLKGGDMGSGWYKNLCSLHVLSHLRQWAQSV